MHKLLYWFTGFLKCRVIEANGKPYLERYYLCTLFGKRIFIHRFMSSDPDRGLHDHPWHWALSLILAGQYNELYLHSENLDDKQFIAMRTKKAGEFNKIEGGKFHRVMLDEEYMGKTWTMFMHGPRDREWGFLEYEKHADNSITEIEYIKADTAAERTQNQSWWKRKETKTGRQLRNEIF